jgi:hypothetical protein
LHEKDDYPVFGASLRVRMSSIMRWRSGLIPWCESWLCSC